MKPAFPMVPILRTVSKNVSEYLLRNIETLRRCCLSAKIHAEDEAEWKELISWCIKSRFVLGIPKIENRIKWQHVIDKGTARGSVFLRAVLKHSGSGKRRALTVL